MTPATKTLPKLIDHPNNQEILDWLLWIYGGVGEARDSDIALNALALGLVKVYEDKPELTFDLTIKGLWFIKLMILHTEPREFEFMFRGYESPTHFIEVIEKFFKQMRDRVPNDQIEYPFD